MSASARPLLGLAITTIGRPALAALLRSAAESSLPPAAVSIANQSGRPLDIDPEVYPFPVTIRPSSGGASAGRNDAINALPDGIGVVGFPNDDSIYPRSALKAVVDRFASDDPPAAIACSSRAGVKYSRDLPPGGTDLDRYTVWRAIEWAIFVDRGVFAEHGGFRAELGTGAPSPWQSGEGTDLLLRLLSRGLPIVSAPEIEIFGPGERRDLTPDEFVAKHRKYARGTGHVYRTHPYPAHVRLRILIAPWLRLGTFDASLPLALRIAFARSFGRLEGLLDHPFGAEKGTA
jgi:hypothetical protein